MHPYIPKMGFMAECSFWENTAVTCFFIFPRRSNGYLVLLLSKLTVSKNNVCKTLFINTPCLKLVHKPFMSQTHKESIQDNGVAAYQQADTFRYIRAIQQMRHDDETPLSYPFFLRGISERQTFCCTKGLLPFCHDYISA